MIPAVQSLIIGQPVELLGKWQSLGKADPTGDLESVSSFHIYLDGQSTSNSAKSLESAMLHAVALGKLEVNEARWMAIGAMKLMGIES